MSRKPKANLQSPDSMPVAGARARMLALGEQGEFGGHSK